MTRTTLLPAALLCLVALAPAPAQAQLKRDKLLMLVGEGLADRGFWRVSPGVVPPAPEGEEDTEEKRFARRLTEVDLDGGGCAAVFPKGTTELYVLVHGIGGAGPEWEPAVQTLARREAGLLMFRWRPTGSRELLAKALAQGVSTLAACAERAGGRVTVLAHSAGGVLTATAASLLKLKPKSSASRLALVTIASPLGGMGVHPGQQLTGWLSFVEELGMRIDDYEAAPAGVRVLHVRTHPDSDRFIGPSTPVGKDAGFVAPGVPGARTVDLGPEDTHESAVATAAKAIAADAWKLWK